MWQPAEEGVRGAKSIVDAGHLDGVDYALAAHILPAGKAAGLVDIGVLKDGAQGGLATAKLDDLVAACRVGNPTAERFFSGK